MKCKSCGRKIPENSIYCCWCGTEQIKKKRQLKEEKTVKVPTPAQLPSGQYHIYLRAEGVSITEPTFAECQAKAIAIRSGLIKTEKTLPKQSLKSMCEKYVKDRNSVFSPSTINGYECIIRTRFKEYMEQNVCNIDFNKMVNEEAAKCAPKTLTNSWRFVVSVLHSNGIEPPKVALPQIPHKELPWLDYKQIQAFLKAIQGKECEIGALLALHGLRKSELLVITPEKIVDGNIIVSGSMVKSVHGFVEKETNKNNSSARKVPVLIPRLTEMLEENDYPPGKPLNTLYPDKLYEKINAVCVANNLPAVGIHGLRRSFVSLAYHLRLSELETMRLGGYQDFKTMRNIYTKLAADDEQNAVKKLKEFYQ